MAPTRNQLKLLREIEDISELLGCDHWSILEYDSEARTPLLQLTRQRLIRGEIILKYSLIDELLTNELCHYFFKLKNGKRPSYQRLWRTKKFRIFVHFLMDEAFLLAKMRAVHAIADLPKNIRENIERINALRNALAHSFFPENRRQYMLEGVVRYRDIDIFTLEGIRKFEADCEAVNDHLLKRLYGA